MRVNLITMAVAAYLHSHPDVFTHAFLLSGIMWTAVILWLAIWVFGLIATAATN